MIGTIQGMNENKIIHFDPKAEKTSINPEGSEPELNQMLIELAREVNNIALLVGQALEVISNKKNQ